MVSLRRLKVQNYRSLHDVDVELRSLNVLVGPNGAGKSNVLDAIRFLGDTARFDLQHSLDTRSGFHNVLFRGNVKPRPSIVRIDVEAEVTKHASESVPDAYSLSFWKPSKSALQRRETFTFKRYRGRGRRITVSGGRIDFEDERRQFPVDTQSAALSTLPRLGEGAGAEQVRQLANLFKTFRVFDPVIADARELSRLEERPQLHADARNLAVYLLWLSSEHPDVFALLCRDMSHVLPGLTDLRAVPYRDMGELYTIELIEQGIREPVSLLDASYGTVRALALLALLHDPNPPRLTCVEEIDHGLHPYALDIIVERMRTAAEKTQLIVVTHSPALVNRLHPDELIVCERDLATGASVIPAVDPHEIAEMTEASSLDLGELWFSGALGGVPA